MHVVLLISVPNFVFIATSVSAIKCKYNDAGEFYANKDCPGHNYCIHVDYDGYKYADCGRSDLKWVNKTIQMLINKNECPGPVERRGRDEEGRAVSFACCNSDFCNSAPSLSSVLINCAILITLAYVIY